MALSSPRVTAGGQGKRGAEKSLISLPSHLQMMSFTATHLPPRSSRWATAGRGAAGASPREFTSGKDCNPRERARSPLRCLGLSLEVTLKVNGAVCRLGSSADIRKQPIRSRWIPSALVCSSSRPAVTRLGAASRTPRPQTHGCPCSRLHLTTQPPRPGSGSQKIDLLPCAEDAVHSPTCTLADAGS